MQDLLLLRHHQYCVLSESIFTGSSLTPCGTAYSLLFCESRARKSAQLETFWQDYFTCKCFVHWPIMQFQTRKSRIYCRAPAAEEFHFHRRSFSADMKAAWLFCVCHFLFFSRIMWIRENSIKSSMPVGYTKFVRKLVICLAY